MEWQPIETAPKDGTKILVWTENGIAEVYWNCYYYYRWHQDVFGVDADGSSDTFLYSEPTYWMPLLKTPNQQGD